MERSVCLKQVGAQVRETKTFFSKEQVQLTILGWRHDWTSPAWDQHHQQVTPGSKEAMATAENAENKFLDTYSHRDYRSLAGLCQCTVDMRYNTTSATKELMRDASIPTMVSL